MKSLNLTLICLIGLLPAVARAQDATTQPTTNPSQMDGSPVDNRDRPRGFDGSFGRFGRPGFYGFGRRFEYPSPVELEEISTFMKEHSPERFKAINNLPEDEKRRLVVLATRNYRNYKRVQTEQPELAQLMVTRIELEDQTFKLVNQVKAEKTRGDTQAAQADQQSLQDKIGDLVDTNIKEREMRIAKLQSTLQTEQNHLADDSKNRDQLVERRLRAFLGHPAGDMDPGKPTTQP